MKAAARVCVCVKVERNWGLDQAAAAAGGPNQATARPKRQGERNLLAKANYIGHYHQFCAVEFGRIGAAHFAPLLTSVRIHTSAPAARSRCSSEKRFASPEDRSQPGAIYVHSLPFVRSFLHLLQEVVAWGEWPWCELINLTYVFGSSLRGRNGGMVCCVFYCYSISCERLAEFEALVGESFGQAGAAIDRKINCAK